MASDYDYPTAYMAKVFGVDLYDKKSKHWASRVPNTPVTDAIGIGGRILKGQNHPTLPLTMKGEAEAGYLMYSTPDRKLWSKKKGQGRGKGK